MCVGFLGQKCHTFNVWGRKRCARFCKEGFVAFMRSLAFLFPDRGMPCFPNFEDSQGAVQRSIKPVSNSILKHICVFLCYDTAVMPSKSYMMQETLI